jgi:hypothetical protein
MPEQLLEEVRIAPQEDLVPPAPPEGLDTALYQHDERAARADLRRQIAAMELALARLFGSAFPRTGIEFAVPGMGGPRLLSVDELEQIRDGLAARIQDVGEPGCKHWHSTPKWGPIGMLLGWWRVKISSGCPLAGGR